MRLGEGEVDPISLEEKSSSLIFTFLERSNSEHNFFFFFFLISTPEKNLKT